MRVLDLKNWAVEWPKDKGYWWFYGITPRWALSPQFFIIRVDESSKGIWTYSDSEALIYPTSSVGTWKKIMQF